MLVRTLTVFSLIVVSGCSGTVPTAADNTVIEACAPTRSPDAYTVQLDPALTEAQRRVVQDAARMWEEADDHIHLELTVSPCTTMASTPEAQGDAVLCVELGTPARVADCGTDLVGCTFVHDVVVSTPGFYPSLLAHELGHAMGLKHGPAGTVMFHAVLDGQRVTPADVAQYESLRQRNCVASGVKTVSAGP